MGSGQCSPPTTSGDQTTELRQFGPPFQSVGKQYVQTPIMTQLVRRWAQNLRLMPPSHSDMCVPDHPPFVNSWSPRRLLHTSNLAALRYSKAHGDRKYPWIMQNLPVSCSDKSLPTALETLSSTALSQRLHSFREIDTVSTPYVSRHSHQVPGTLRPSPDLITTPLSSSCEPRAGESIPLANRCAHTPQHGAGVQTAALLCRKVECSFGLPLSLQSN